jgi:NitT/TauT family transport system substrate-binding protein
MIHSFDPRVLRRRLLAALGGVALSPALTSCGWQKDLPVSVAAHVWVGYEPLFMSRDRGWLDGKQVTLQETRSALESIAAL